ncbi:hypothetical protein G1C96_1097 [Bifidobacterium sp. DSM 109958]|uniref:Uncharacterized protein n=1 Tax=Bifidobacterium moraviense TaxID=2675323 RepID=A0A7Y0HZM2_9BIFI|nr:hypothetical protein [Bifidobacterium sp. DSM 109958]
MAVLPRERGRAAIRVCGAARHKGRHRPGERQSGPPPCGRAQRGEHGAAHMIHAFPVRARLFLPGFGFGPGSVPISGSGHGCGSGPGRERGAVGLAPQIPQCFGADAEPFGDGVRLTPRGAVHGYAALTGQRQHRPPSVGDDGPRTASSPRACQQPRLPRQNGGRGQQRHPEWTAVQRDGPGRGRDGPPRAVAGVLGRWGVGVVASGRARADLRISVPRRIGERHRGLTDHRPRRRGRGRHGLRRMRLLGRGTERHPSVPLQVDLRPGVDVVAGERDERGTVRLRLGPLRRG